MDRVWFISILQLFNWASVDGCQPLCAQAAAVAVSPCSQRYYAQQLQSTFVPQSGTSYNPAIDTGSTFTQGARLAAAAVTGATTMYFASKARKFFKSNGNQSSGLKNSHPNKSSSSYSRDASAIEKMTAKTSRIERERSDGSSMHKSRRSNSGLSSTSTSDHSNSKGKSKSGKDGNFSVSRHISMHARMKEASLSRS